MRYTGTIITVILFLILIYLALKAYIKANLGKEKKEVKDINTYIFGSIIYVTIATIIIVVTLFNKI